MTEHKTYIGDGAYVDHGGYMGEIVLTTEDGISAQNTIVLGPYELATLFDWLRRTGILKSRETE